MSLSVKPVYRLSESAVLEPLVNCWPAWSFPLAPATASLHLADYQLRLLESYLANPTEHLKACAHKGLSGGPFVNLPLAQLDAVRKHLEDTRHKQSDHLTFAAAFKAFQNEIVSAATGECLEPYYSKTPAELRGYVELVYDYHHRASVRLIEGLLYQSKYYKPELQAIRFDVNRSDTSRPFFINTPRLAREGDTYWWTPFSSSKCDQLFRLDTQPMELPEAVELLGTEPSAAARWLTPDEPRAERNWSGRRARVRYFGHACVLVQWQGVSILTDPVVGTRPSGAGEPRYSFHDLPDHIDFALVTHNHHDHFNVETLIRLRHRVGKLVVPKAHGLLVGDISLKGLAEKLGFRDVVEVDSFDSVQFDGGEIVAVPFLGEHGDLAHGKTAYVARLASCQMLFAADSDCLDVALYENIRAALGRVETVFLGTECVGAPLTWVCGPLFPRRPTARQEQTRRYHGCNARAATEILCALGASTLYNYAMGREPWMSHILGLALDESSPQMRESDELLAAARQHSITAERPFGKAEFYLAPVGMN